MSDKLRVDEISNIIKDRIDNFDLNIDIEETGKVIAVADGVANIYGLQNVMANERVA